MASYDSKASDGTKSSAMSTGGTKTVTERSGEGNRTITDNTPRIGDTFSKDNGRNQIEFQILDMRDDGAASIKVTRSTFDTISRFSEGKTVLVDNNFLSRNTRKISESPARRGENSYLGREREQAFGKISKLREGSRIRVAYGDGTNSTYTVQTKNGKTYLLNNQTGRKRQVSSPSAARNVLGQPNLIEIR